MSLHRSLRIDSAGAQQRTVLSRIERIKDLMKKGLWTDSTNANALPKTKIIKIKAAKAAPKAAADGKEGAAAPAAGAAKTDAKAAAKK
jgi:small basic protein (TIGR04137 family)